MYNCAHCHVTQPPRTLAIPIVVKTRPMTYLNWKLDEEGNKVEVNSKGSEIVHELRVCADCFEELSKVLI